MEAAYRPSHPRARRIRQVRRRGPAVAQRRICRGRDKADRRLVGGPAVDRGLVNHIAKATGREAILDSASNTPFCTLHLIFRISPRAGTVADTFLGPLRPGCDGRVCYSLVKPTKSKHIPVITALPGTKTAS